MKGTEQLSFADNQLVASLFGQCDAHLLLIEKRLNISLHARGNVVAITAPTLLAKEVRHLLETLYTSLEQGHPVDHQRVEHAIRILEERVEKSQLSSVREVIEGDPLLRTPHRTIYPRNPRQASYMNTLTRSDLTFAIGPAGTGKTYLAVAAAVSDFLAGRVGRIVLTRPAVEAGERLGFLPGDLHAKVDPYLRPLYDALHHMLGLEKVERMLEQNVLEVAPLAYMRGRTLEEAFIILDEGQNSTAEQMKMFLTRLGEGSKMVIAGDITQIDLPHHQISGLVQAMKLLSAVEGVSFVHFSHTDSVRHPLVQKIVHAYEQANSVAKPHKRVG